MSTHNLTQEEVAALPAVFNLCDGHAYRRWNEAEAAVIASASSLLEGVDRARHLEIETAYIECFLALARQSRIPGFYSTFMVFTASMGIEIVANYLRINGCSAALIEPCFDNLADILRRHDVPLQSFPEQALCDDLTLLDRQLDELTADAIVLVSPNNPTGTAMSDRALARIVEFCRTEKKLLVLDACFRFYLPACAIHDQYRMIAEADIDCIIIEDTGKTWPTVELKAPFLSVSPRLAGSVGRLHSDFLLHVSPFAVALLTEFIAVSREDQFSHVQGLVDGNRSMLNDAVAGSALHPVDAGYLSLAWLRIDSPAIRSQDLKESLAGRGVRVLAGNRFFWSQPQAGDRYLRVALVRDPDLFGAAAQRIRSVCDELKEIS